MASIPQKRDRHGRGMRRPIPSKLFRHGLSRQTFFQDAVADTADYLRSRFPEELGALNWKIEEVPLQERPESLNRWHTRPQTMTIILYRIPIERSASSRTSDPRIQIEQAVVSAAASLLGKEPWDLLDQ
jgi:hypothetical protein